MNTKREKIVALRKEAKAFNWYAVLAFISLFLIPYLPIHIIGQAMFCVLAFACGMAFACEATQLKAEANGIEKRMYW
jgi:hypothetical protein